MSQLARSESPPGFAATDAADAADHIALWARFKLAAIRARGSRGGADGKAIPKTTNQDVIGLVARWSDEFLAVVLRDPGQETEFDHSERERWRRAIESVQTLTTDAAPLAEYVDNERLWQDQTQRLAIHLEARRTRTASASAFTDRLADRLHEQRNADGGPPPPTPTAAPPAPAIEASDHIVLWAKLKAYYLAHRSSVAGANGKAIPRTTNRDVIALVTRWQAELARAGDRDEDRDKSERERWAACVAEVDRHTRGVAFDAEYPANEPLWQECTLRLAQYLESLKMRPSRWELLSESVGEAVAEIGDTLAGAAASVGKAGGGAAKAATSGLLGALLWPAALVGGGLLIFRAATANGRTS